MSAASATNAEPPHADHATSTDFVLIRGDARTYRLREKLRAYGLEWVPDQHAWVGPLSGGRQWFLEERCGLHLTTTVPITPAPEPLSSGAPREAPSPAPPARPAKVNWGGRRPKDGGRTSLESCLALQGLSLSDEPSRASPSEVSSSRGTRQGRFGFLGDSDDEEGDREGRPFGARETTAGLEDDAREADERRASARLRDRRGRVKAARAALAAAPPSAREAFAGEAAKRAAFLARWGVTSAQFSHGVAAPEEGAEGPCEALRSPSDGLAEVREREGATLPGEA